MAAGGFLAILDDVTALTKIATKKSATPAKQSAATQTAVVEATKAPAAKAATATKLNPQAPWPFPTGSKP